MKTLNLKIQGGYGPKPVIKIDDKIVPCKKNKYNSDIITYCTEKDFANISLFNVLELNGPCWWLVQMLFFIISCFGIFNQRWNKNNYKVFFDAKINLSEGVNDVILKFNQPKDGERAITVIGEVNATENKNEFVLDSKVLKRKKILKWSYVLSYIILVITLFVLLFWKVIG